MWKMLLMNFHIQLFPNLLLDYLMKIDNKKTLAAASETEKKFNSTDPSVYIEEYWYESPHTK